MQKYLELSKLLNIIPEAIAILAIFNILVTKSLLHICLLWLICSVTFRFIWNSAIIVHGLGHTIAIALIDRQLSIINSTNILEHQSISSIFKSLLPFNYIFIPIVSPSLIASNNDLSVRGNPSQVAGVKFKRTHRQFPYIEPEKPEQVKLKAIGGIVFNLLVAITISSCFDNFLSQILIVANLLIAFSSVSDLEAFITGAADCFYCGNFGLIAERKPDDGQKLLPARMLNIALQMGQETEVRGEQAGGGLVIGSQGNESAFVDKKIVLVGKKIVNHKRNNLTKSLEAAFAPIRNKAVAAGVKPLESTVTGVWHYRYATSGTPPSELETHWHEWMGARDELVWQFTGKEWLCKIKNVHHCITHNGDFDSWEIFNREVDNATLGLWLERVLHTPNKTKGDSPKIAGMMDLLVTKGMWYPSVRLAYQQAIATSIEDAFDGQQPTATAPNTAPSHIDLNIWSEIFQRSFTAELSKLKCVDSSNLDSYNKTRRINSSSLPKRQPLGNLRRDKPHKGFAVRRTDKLHNDIYDNGLSRNAPDRKIKTNSWKFSTSFQRSLIEAFRNHNLSANWSKLQIISFVQSTLKAFFDNDLYRATQIFISQAEGSFGLVTASTLLESELVLCAKGQPISIGFNWSQGYMVYASEPAAVDRILLNQPQSFRLDLDQSGEVAKVSAKNIIIYSLTRQQEMRRLELKNRWISMTEHPHLSQIRLTQTKQDPVAYDINSIPQVLHEIKTDWENPISLNRRSADYLISLIAEKVQRFKKKQRLMFKAGLLSKIRQMRAVDLLIAGEENSLWLGEKFAQDLEVVFPFLNIVTISANQILQQLDRGFGQLNLGEDSLVLAITQSGQTFSTLQVINVFDNLSSQGIIGELFIMTGELSSFVNSTQGKGGITGITHSSFLDNGLSGNHRSRVFVNGSGRRTAEPSTVAVAAARQTLTELLLYLAKQMRHNFPHTDPFGMTLTVESLMVLAMMKKDFLNKNVLQIIGTTSQGKSIKSATRQTLIQGGSHWANHVTETPLAWSIQALYVFISVGWVIPFGHPLPLVKTLSGLLFDLVNLPVDIIQFLAPIVNFADIAVYIFGTWLWTLAIRYFQGRQLLARMGKRTLIIGDVPWVNQLLQAYVSKLFSLSYGIATIEVHSDNPQNHLLHSFGHRIVRGTLIWLGIPDGRHSKQQQVAESAVIMTGKHINGIRSLNVGAEIIAMSNNPTVANQGFTKALILNSNNDSIYFRSSSLEQKEQIEKLRESCFASFQRLLASYVFFWALAKKVASFPFLKYEYWKSQSRTKTMSTASPVAGFDLNKLTSKNISVGLTQRKD